MQLTIDEARQLIVGVMQAFEHTADEAGIIADHLIDCELRGLAYGGLPRALSIAEHLQRTGNRRRPIEILQETPVSARLDGGDYIGYIVALRAMEIAIEKASASGVAMVGANNTWYTGMLSYFAEMAAAEGLVSMIASNTSPWVAPHGASEGRYGTNPICFGFPGEDDPVIWDIGTSAITHAEVTLAGRRGEGLDEGMAFDPEGRPTRNPAAALEGAFAPWAGHRGSGLGLVVQMLGIMAGSPPLPPHLEDFGILMVVMKPDLLVSAEEFRANIAAYAESVRGARPVEGGPPVRMPFDRSAAERRKRREANAIEIDDAVHARLKELAA